MTLKPLIIGLTDEELASWMAGRKFPKFRVNQVQDWLWNKRVSSFDEMMNLPAALREALKQDFDIGALEVEEVQGRAGGTRKFLSRMRDGQYVESVVIPATRGDDGEKSDRVTLCVSSQIGCAFGCKFCASGLLGFSRNLEAGEIVAQILAAEALCHQRVDNLVFMGMGEPLANFDNLLRSLDIITSPQGLNIGARHITVSTSGHAPNLRKLARYSKQIRLAVSLHGASDEVRNQIMPINKKWPLDELVSALEEWNSIHKQMPTFEYILIRDVNDSLEDADRLITLAKRLHAKINLIPYNTVEGLDWVRPPLVHCENFREKVKKANLPVTLRYEKGHDIDAACGQLRLRKEGKKNS